MLHILTIEGNFAHKQATFLFDKGLTAITGKNGMGKSEILEMIRFALFGTGALRTAATDYKKTKVELHFSVRGIAYNVTRTTKTASLYREGDLIATGVRPVNLKMTEVFGYGLEVFDTANSAQQGEIEALSAMLPGDRKRLVDSTVGLTVLDDLAKWCRDEANTTSRSRAGLIENLAPLVEPIKPAQMFDEEELKAKHAALMELDRERRGLEHTLANPPVVGEMPVCQFAATAEEMQTAIHALNSLKSELKQTMNALLKTKEAKLTQEQIDEAERINIQILAIDKASRHVLDTSVPSRTLEQLDAIEASLHLHDSWKEWKRLAEKGESQCPACGHNWFHMEGDMVKLGDWQGKTPPPNPELTSLLVISRLRHQIAEFESIKHLYAASVAMAAQPRPVATHTAAQLAEAARALDDAPHRAELQARVAELTTALAGRGDYTELLPKRLEYDRALRAWEAASESRATWDAEEPARRQRLATLGDVAGSLAEVIQQMVELGTYKALLSVFEQQRVAHAATTAKIEALRVEVEGYQTAQAALMAIKVKVKSHLVPSLSKVASVILHQMTNGALSQVVVDEEFDITVDGKVINGLSGAGKAAANLALRFGLGQVLTNRVFSVFMADEIDASMDEDRAQYIAECLRNLTTNIAQIILVSHKTPDADQYITL